MRDESFHNILKDQETEDKHSAEVIYEEIIRQYSRPEKVIANLFEMIINNDFIRTSVIKSLDKEWKEKFIPALEKEFKINV